MKQHNIRWGLIEMELYEPEMNWKHLVMVVEQSEDIYVSYWVKCGEIFNVIVRHTGNIVGVGAKKYEEKINYAVSKFKTQKWQDEFAWKDPENRSEFIRVIDGGKSGK